MRQKPALSLDIPGPLSEGAEVDVVEGERKEMEMRAKYDAQLIAHERTERKLDDAEKDLDQEREKNGQIRQELLKGIDVEKDVRDSCYKSLGSKSSRCRTRWSG